jgi:uncharacterized protein
MSTMRRLLVPASVFLVCLIAAPVGRGRAPAQTSDELLDTLRPQGYVNDFAGVAGSQAAAIESLLMELEQKTGSQVAVVTVRTLGGDDLTDFAVRLFERWGIGQADQDNGVLLIAAIEDRDVRIEVGYGLEGAIPDAEAGRILDQAVLPFFRDGDYGSGLGAGAAAIAEQVAREAGVELTGVAAVQVRGQGGTATPFGGLLQVLFVLAAIILFWRHPWLLLLLLASGRHGGGRHGGGFGRGGGGFGGFGGGMSGGGGAGRSW